jgi:hypothetical protein
MKRSLDSDTNAPSLDSLDYRKNEAEFFRIAGEAMKFDFSDIEKSTTKESVYEFKRFIALKALYRDTNCSYLSPSFIVDEVWHKILLLPAHYYRLCNCLLHAECKERIIDHNPDGSLEGAPQLERYQRTLDAYRLFFKEDPPAHMWPKPEQLSSMTKKHAVSSSKSSPDSVANSEEEKINITLYLCEDSVLSVS